MVSQRKYLILLLVLIAAVGAIYGQTFRHDFLGYDDNVYLTENPMITTGLSLDGFRWAFGFHLANWHPLTWLSHQFDWELFGPQPGWHHLENAAFHALNAVLVLSLFQRMTGTLWPSAAIAALFALHPLRVESVAWVAERKDLLSACLQLLTLLVWLDWVERGVKSRYVASVALFGLSLTAKAMPITTPLLMLLLDWWPLGRIEAPWAPRGERVLPRRTSSALFVEKIPFVVLSIISAAVTLKAQSTGVVPMVLPSIQMRISNALVSYVAYLRDFFWPAGLGLLYPYPKEIPVWRWVGAALLLVLLTGSILRHARKRPYLVTGWLWYVIALFPVIGLVQVGGQARADRYTYIPLLGVSVSLVWLVYSLWPRSKMARRALSASVAAIMLVLGCCAAVQASRWKNDLTILSHTIRATGGDATIRNNLGVAQLEAGQKEDAVNTLSEAILLNPGYCDSYYNLGNALAASRRHGEAVRSYELALQCYSAEPFPRWDYIVDTDYNLAQSLRQVGRLAEAEWHLRQVLALNPQHRFAQRLLSIVLEARSLRE